MNESASLPRSLQLLDRGDSALLVIDIQEKLLPHIDGGLRVAWNVRRLLDGARLLDVPILATEQYPKGLGPTVAPLAERLPAQPCEKTMFSVRQCGPLIETLRDRGRFKIVLAGIETHVCVAQSALDLIALGFDVYVPADAVGSRFETDKRIALHRMELSGATVTTVESVLFEWCETADDEQFKPISLLVRESPPEGAF